MTVNIVMLTYGRKDLADQTVRTAKANAGTDAYTFHIQGDTWPHTGIVGEVRNRGIRLSEKYNGRGDWLLCIDNDLYFFEGWLARLTSIDEQAEKYGFKVIGPWNHPYLQPNGAQLINSPERWQVYSHDAVCGASMLMRWETWDKYGPFDSHAVGVGQSEDTKFCQDIVRDGGLVGSVYPRLAVNCGLTNSLGEKSPGYDLMLNECLEAKRLYPEIYFK